MSTINVVVTCPHAISNNDGSFMFPSRAYKATVTDLIKSYINVGHLTEVVKPEPAAEAVPVENDAPAPKPTTIKSKTPVASKTQENSDG